MLIKQSTASSVAMILGVSVDDVRAALQGVECFPCGWLVSGATTVELCYPMGAMIAVGERLVRDGIATKAALSRLLASEPR